MATPSRASGRSVNVAQLVSLFLAFLMVAGVGGVLSAGFLMPFVAAVGATTQAGVNTFNDLDTEIGDLSLSERSVILYSDGRRMATFYSEDRIVVPQDEIAPMLQAAVIAVEDRRFYQHGAIDPEGMFRALIQNLFQGGIEQGGSTLTQQYVKNVLLEQARTNDDAEAIQAATAQTIGRKLREAKLAIGLEQRYTKDEILTGYLNIAQFGPSQYGVEAAARYFFSKSAADVGVGEAALLAGITNSPNGFNPVTNPERATERRDIVLRLMQQQGVITQEEHDLARERSVEDMLDVQSIPPTCATAGRSAYFCQYVVQTILSSPEFGETRGDRNQLLLRGGLRIQTTIDRQLQAEGYEALTDAVPTDDPSGISNAISTVEPGTGRILAMVQNTPYGKPDGDRDRTTEINFNADQALGGGQGFQTGSTFKAFILAAWLEAGNSLYDVVDARQGQSFPRSDWDYSGCTDHAPQEPYEPKNIDGVGNGQMRVLDVTIDSVNTAFVNMESQLNMCDVYDLTQRVGLHVGTGTYINDAGEDTGETLLPSPSMVLGSNFIAPVTMAAAFAAFAAEGEYCEPIAIDAVTGPDGEELPVPESECQRAMSEDVAATVTFALEQVVSSPRGSATGKEAAIPGFEIAGKTGTANNNYAAWFIGYTPQVATAVWNGHSEGSRSMSYQDINGQYFGQVYGGNFAAPIWQDYMSQAVDILDLSPQSFPEPDDKLVMGERRWVPSVANMSVEQATQTLQGAGFQVRQGGSEENESVPSGSVVRTQPESGSLQSQGATITLITSSGQPAPDNNDGDNGGGGDDSGDNGGGGDDSGDNGGRPGGPGDNRGPGDDDDDD